MTLIVQCPACKRGIRARPTTPRGAILHCKCGARLTRPPAPPKRKRTMVQRATP